MYLSPVPLSIVRPRQVKYPSANKLWGAALPQNATGSATGVAHLFFVLA